MGIIPLNRILDLLITKYACIDLILFTSAFETETMMLHLLIYVVHEFVQMKQIRTALAIASLLNRTLVRTIFWDHKMLIKLHVESQISHISTLKHC